MRREARTAGAIAATFLLGGAGALVSCNWIVGSSDYVVGSSAGDATAPIVADAGASSPSDSGAETANARDQGGPIACGDGLLVGSPDFAQLVGACVLTVSCDPYFFPLNISECVSNDYLRAAGSVSCLATISDCAGFNSCQGFGFASATDCVGGPSSTGCDNASNRAINCSVDDAGRTFNTVQSCTKLGGTCAAYGDPAAGTAVADCVVVPACSASSDAGSQCAGSKLHTCLNGVGYGQDCANTVSTCETVNGSTGCYLNAPPCSSPGYTCNGTTLEWCTSAHTQLSYHCGRAGESCVLDDAGGGQCRAPGCLPATAPSCVESCGADGHTMSVCVGGAPLSVDCTKYSSFTACSTSTHLGTVYAYCY